MKLGRVFREPVGRPPALTRPAIPASQYAAHLGAPADFERKLDGLLRGYANLGQRVVCSSDGAVWLKHYWPQSLPTATLILDFWHVVEKLAGVARDCLPNQLARKAWLEEQQQLLKESALEQVKHPRQALPKQRDLAKETARVVLPYIENNTFPMDYKSYLQQGLRIGSGAMEAAHRSVIQSRMKRSGQRWSDKGAPNWLNLRVAYKSGKAKLIHQIITGKAA